MSQYTIRNIPDSVDRELRNRAKRMGRSLNETAVEALKRGVGIGEEKIEYHDMDDLIGSWKQDEEFDRALAEQDQVEPELWQ